MATKTLPAPLTRPLAAVAAEIVLDHQTRGKALYFGAVPYVNAMMFAPTGNLGASFGEDDLDTVVLYALSNLSSWRGETARRVKAELQAARAYHAIATPLPRISRGISSTGCRL
jgi:hypothetical protein